MAEYTHKQRYPNRMPTGGDELICQGDNLIVAVDLSESDNVLFGVNDKMVSLRGTKVTVASDGYRLSIAEDGGGWSWSCQMFENIVARGDKLYKVVHGETPEGEGYFLEYTGELYDTPLDEEVEEFEF